MRASTAPTQPLVPSLDRYPRMRNGYCGHMKPEDVALTVITFFIAMAVFAWLFRITFDRAIGASISFSAAPALISAGVTAWALRRRGGNS